MASGAKILQEGSIYGAALTHFVRKEKNMKIKSAPGLI